MSAKAMSLKARIKNYAKTSGIAAQVVLQNYMFERLLARLSSSNYQNNFIVKGGILIAAIVGLDVRTTMDLDATARDFSLTEANVEKAFKEICSIDMHDDVEFVVKSLSLIREDDCYGGFRMRVDAIYDTMRTPLSIDVSTGDVMTPGAVQYEFTEIFDKSERIKLWGYNIETVMAEKIETILSRGVLNSRPRDFYDVFILEARQVYDRTLLLDALKATMAHRGTSTLFLETEEIIEQLSNNQELLLMWRKYQDRFDYARDITYEDIINTLRRILSKKDLLIEKNG